MAIAVHGKDLTETFDVGPVRIAADATRELQNASFRIFPPCAATWADAIDDTCLSS